MLPADAAEGALRPQRFHALVALVHDEQVEFQLADPAHAGAAGPAAEPHGVLQPLEALKGNHAFPPLRGVLLPEGQVLLPTHGGGMAAHDLAVADKAEFVPPGDEFQEIVRPGVGDAGAVGDDQDLPEAHAPHQIVGCQFTTFLISGLDF